MTANVSLGCVSRSNFLMVRNFLLTHNLNETLCHKEDSDTVLFCLGYLVL